MITFAPTVAEAGLNELVEIAPLKVPVAGATTAGKVFNTTTPSYTHLVVGGDTKLGVGMACTTAVVVAVPAHVFKSE